MAAQKAALMQEKKLILDSIENAVRETRGRIGTEVSHEDLIAASNVGQAESLTLQQYKYSATVVGWKISLTPYVQRTRGRLSIGFVRAFVPPSGEAEGKAMEMVPRTKNNLRGNVFRSNKEVDLFYDALIRLIDRGSERESAAVSGAVVERSAGERCDAQDSAMSPGTDDSLAGTGAGSDACSLWIDGGDDAALDDQPSPASAPSVSAEHVVATAASVDEMDCGDGAPAFPRVTISFSSGGIDLNKDGRLGGSRGNADGGRFECDCSRASSQASCHKRPRDDGMQALADKSGDGMCPRDPRCCKPMHPGRCKIITSPPPLCSKCKQPWCPRPLLGGNCAEEPPAGDVDEVCSVCQQPYSLEGWNDMLICDGCDKLFHQYCLAPPVRLVPMGDWYCSQACRPPDSSADGGSSNALGDEPAAPAGAKARVAAEVTAATEAVATAKVPVAAEEAALLVAMAKPMAAKGPVLTDEAAAAEKAGAPAMAVQKPTAAGVAADADQDGFCLKDRRCCKKNGHIGRCKIISSPPPLCNVHSQPVATEEAGPGPVSTDAAAATHGAVAAHPPGKAARPMEKVMRQAAAARTAAEKARRSHLARVAEEEQACATAAEARQAASKARRLAQLAENEATHASLNVPIFEADLARAAPGGQEERELREDLAMAQTRMAEAASVAEGKRKAADALALAAEAAVARAEKCKAATADATSVAARAQARLERASLEVEAYAREAREKKAARAAEEEQVCAAAAELRKAASEALDDAQMAENEAIAPSRNVPILEAALARTESGGQYERELREKLARARARMAETTRVAQETRKKAEALALKANEAAAHVDKCKAATARAAEEVARWKNDASTCTDASADAALAKAQGVGRRL
jgi:hypothetical protein